jgi:hypothetical protein
MLLSITKIELNSYARFFAFFKFNGQIINELKGSHCKKYKITGSWNLKSWYTMTLWNDEADLTTFYRSGTHLEAMKQASLFSSKIQVRRLESNDLVSWKVAKKLVDIDQRKQVI